MAAPTQLGTAYKIGYGSLSYSGYVPVDTVTSEAIAEIDAITDHDGATVSKLISNPGKRFSADFYILDPDGTLKPTPPAVGATVTLTPPEGTATGYRCESASIKFGRKFAVLSVTLIAETSMSYT